MPKFDRTEVLQQLDARHDELLSELEELNRQIEQALVARDSATASRTTPCD